LNLAVAGNQVTELTTRARSLGVTFASAGGKVKSRRVFTKTNATAITGCLVPDFIVIALIRKRLAFTVAVVDIFVSGFTLFDRATLRFDWIGYSSLHELRIELC